MNYQLFQKKKCVSWSGLRQAQGQGGGFFKRSKKRRQKQKGQISIFAILIFPVLFMIFAMSINITLVVHDKINLQNSVDLAAYYGAMKQAEMLNAIAHINYQIRQSWKLLVWRYRVLGTMGASAVSLPSPEKTEREYLLRVFAGPRVRRTSPPGPLRSSMPELDQSPIEYDDYPLSQRPTPYFVCIGHKYWKDFLKPVNPPETVRFATYESEGDNLCHKINESISNLPVPSFSRVVTDMIGDVEGQVISANTAMNDKCDIYGFNSWLLATFFFYHFKKDQSARKIMIYHLAKKLADRESGGIGLDGGAIERGAKKTFIKNLTYANKQSALKNGELKPPVWKVKNSLKYKPPRSWLKDQPFKEYGLYSKIIVKPGSTDACDKSLSLIGSVPEEYEVEREFKEKFLSPINHGNHPWYSCFTSGNCESSAGLKKDLIFKIYYKVEVDIPYKGQIFFPSPREIRLKANAIAKPFGGTIGPENSKDERLPQTNSRLTGNSIHYSRVVPHLPNYSRYPGDKLGLTSQYVHWYWANKLRRELNAKFIGNYLKLDVVGEDVLNTDNDPLAIDSNVGPGSLSTERQWELLAISPDLFDVTYFTILPYYQYTYFDKVRDLIQGDMPTGMKVRGDLGSFYKNTEYNQRSILEQIFDLSGIPDESRPNDSPSLKRVWSLLRSSDFTDPPTYKILKPEHLLTGWNPPKDKYKLPIPRSLYGENPPRKTPFGTCQKWAPLSNNNGKGPIANGCVIGGRTGYSVKLVKSVEAP